MLSRAPAGILDDEVHVWLAQPEPLPLPELGARYESLLNDEERRRCGRFHFEHDRKHYLAAHAMLRLALGHYLGSAPQHVRLAPGANGKPQLAPDCDLPPLRFNLSHTRGMVACALTLGRDCGIDVERVRPMVQMEGVAATVFSEVENAGLASSAGDQRLATFFTLWTLKEAYIKATGLGMSAPLRQISIDPHSLRMRDDSRPQHEWREWLFDSWQPGPGHALALACADAMSVREIVYHELNLKDGSLSLLRRYRAGAALG